MAIDINATLDAGRCYACLPASQRRLIYAGLLCRIVQFYNPSFACSQAEVFADGFVAGLPPGQQAWLQFKLLCLLAQVDDPTFDCDADALAASDPCIFCTLPDVWLTLLVTLAAETLEEIDPGADTSPNAILGEQTCLTCLWGGMLETAISHLLIAWLETFQTVDPRALVAECPDCHFPALPYQVIAFNGTTVTPPPPPQTFFLLLETGDKLLFETGDRILLENAP